MDVSTVTTVSEDDGTFVHFKDAAGELMYDGEGDARTPVGARVAGTYSERYRKAQRKVTDRNLKRRRRGAEIDPDQLDANGFELEAAVILEWTFTANGQPFPITPDNWTDLAKRQPQWQEQIAAAMADHERFFSKKSSS